MDPINTIIWNQDTVNCPFPLGLVLPYRNSHYYCFFVGINLISFVYNVELTCVYLKDQMYLNLYFNTKYNIVLYFITVYVKNVVYEFNANVKWI